MFLEAKQLFHVFPKTPCSDFASASQRGLGLGHRRLRLTFGPPSLDGPIGACAEGFFLN